MLASPSDLSHVVLDARLLTKHLAVQFGAILLHVVQPVYDRLVFVRSDQHKILESAFVELLMRGGLKIRLFLVP